MLAFIVPAYVHQLNRVQRTPAAPRSACGMRSLSLECKFDRYQPRISGISIRNAEVAGHVRKNTGINILEISVTYIVSLRTEQFFCNTGPEHQCATDLLAFHDLFNHKGTNDVQRLAGV